MASTKDRRGSERRGLQIGNPLRAAMAMVTFFISRAGARFAERGRDTRERVKAEVPGEMNRPTRAATKPKKARSKAKGGKSRPKRSR